MIHRVMALILFAGSASALELSLPVDCAMGERCYIQSLVDRDPGDGAADFTCGSLSYDGHKGVDFRVATFAELSKGVDILAAAPGQVRAIRDGEPDTGAAHFAKGKDCGNAVVIRHQDGWETQYCHMARGSIAVRPGDQVAAGAVLGRMGYSGRTEFPHLHLSVRKDGAPIDPFGAQPIEESCATAETDSLWAPAIRDQVAYRPGGVVDMGLTPTAPTISDIRAGDRLPQAQANAPALILWARFFGVRSGDVLALTLISPTGAEIVANRTAMTRNRAEEMRYVGKKARGVWRQGRYQATVSLIRGGDVIDRKTGEFILR